MKEPGPLGDTRQVHTPESTTANKCMDGHNLFWESRSAEVKVIVNITSKPVVLFYFFFF